MNPLLTSSRQRTIRPDDPFHPPKTMKQNDNQPTPYADLVTALSKTENVGATKANSHFKSRYVTLDALLDAVKPVLADHNLTLFQRIDSTTDGRVGIISQFIHRSGHVFEAGSLFINASTLNSQQIGSAITYLRRQSIQTACLISTDLDDDGARASGNSQKRNADDHVWFNVIPESEREAAKKWLIKKGWLANESNNLFDLPDKHVQNIVAQPAAFLAAIRKDSANA